ncbi:MAG: hypothetical protein M3387_11460 [Actinomycetota bacterium]|nr:hypothetical protein [Actinomycetota bacterium]
MVDNTVQSLTAWIGAGARAAVALRGSQRRRSTWVLLAASAAAWGLGQATWSYYELVVGSTTPFPSLADIGFLAARGLAVAALMFAAVAMGPMSLGYSFGDIAVLSLALTLAGSGGQGRAVAAAGRPLRRPPPAPPARRGKVPAGRGEGDQRTDGGARTLVNEGHRHSGAHAA